ncbi:putative RNA-directed DNA polymerase from transposon X-element [Trichonephila clavipes]|nr:putative RNA-directed DNA polymerase from transposon X-element [Trichonephila clavipes]
MAHAQQTDMDFTPQSPLSTASSGTAPTPCEELTAMKTYIRRLRIICNEKEKTVSLLRLDHGHDESDTLYQLAWNEFQDVQGTLQQAVSDFDSLPPCTNPGCSHLISPKNTPKSTPPPSPTRRSAQLKRKDEEDFEFPPLRKTARKTILEKSEDLILDNQFSLLPNVIMKQITGQVAPSTATPKKPTDNANENQNQGTNALPPPVMMKITKTYREQVDTMKKYFPHLRLKTTGEYIKLYSNTAEQNRAVKHTMKSLRYRFYVITPKNERPIKIVIKGFPKTADPENIKADLEAEGFEPDKVTQLVGRRTKQKLPIFLVTLPRSIENLKIFDLKTLAHLNITVDGYNGKGITQCYACQNFHHNSDNCFLQPRCLKCGEEHLTKDCPIKQRLETKFCINCQVYGHMANWHEQHSPDLILIQETHLRPSHNINIANYTYYRNDRPTSSDNNRAFGGTLILVKNAINHYSLPTPPMQAIEATIVILIPFDHDPISIVSVYIPPNSDEYTFTIDIENIIQTSSNCVLFGDFNATHTAWNCTTNSSRGVRLLDYTNLANLYIAHPNTPTRFGLNSANTLDIAVIRNFYYPYTINSLHELSSDHNPVILNFTLKLNKEISLTPGQFTRTGRFFPNI